MSDRKTTRQERGVVANWNDSWLESERKDLERDLKNGGSSYKRTLLNAIKDEQDDRRRGR